MASASWLAGQKRAQRRRCEGFSPSIRTSSATSLEEVQTRKSPVTMWERPRCAGVWSRTNATTSWQDSRTIHRQILRIKKAF